MEEVKYALRLRSAKQLRRSNELDALLEDWNLSDFHWTDSELETLVKERSLEQVRLYPNITVYMTTETAIWAKTSRHEFEELYGGRLSKDPRNPGYWQVEVKPTVPSDLADLVSHIELTQALYLHAD